MTDFPPLPIKQEFEPINTQMTDTEILDYTRGIKLRLVQTLSTKLPDDPKEIRCLMEVMESLDKVALHNIKNSIQQDSNDAINEANAIMRRIQAQVGNTDPYMVDVSPTQEAREVVIEESLVEVEFVPGELSHEIRDLRYKSFVDEYEDENPQ